MRNRLLCACVAVALSLLTACESDTYDKGEGRYSLTQADFVEAYTNSEKAVERVVTDDGDAFTVVPPTTASWIKTADSTYRAIIYYNKVSETTVEPVGISSVPVLTVRTVGEIPGGMKTDPVDFESVWLSGNGKYLNLSVYLKVGQTDADSVAHSIAMVCDDVRHNADSTATSYLRFYHNQGGVPEYYSSKCYISVPCSQIQGDSVCLTINTYDGTVSRRLKK